MLPVDKDGYTGCLRCTRSWQNATPHPTPHTPTSSIFPLCEDCWSVLTPAERVPYYLRLNDEWREQLPGHEHDEAELREIVLNETAVGAA